MDKKERNGRVVKIYTDNGKDIDRTVSIIETIPELAKAFNGKNIRRSTMGILQVAKVWEKLPEKPKAPKDNGPTKKELATEFCRKLEIDLADVPTLLNMKKAEIKILIDAI